MMLTNSKPPKAARCQALAIKEMIEIYNIENLDELSVHLSKQEQGKARNWLLVSLISYTTTKTLKNGMNL